MFLNTKRALTFHPLPWLQAAPQPHLTPLQLPSLIKYTQNECTIFFSYSLQTNFYRIKHGRIVEILPPERQTVRQTESEKWGRKGDSQRGRQGVGGGEKRFADSIALGWWCLAGCSLVCNSEPNLGQQKRKIRKIEGYVGGEWGGGQFGRTKEAGAGAGAGNISKDYMGYKGE